MTYAELQDWIYLKSVRTEEGVAKNLARIYQGSLSRVETKLESYREKKLRGAIVPEFEEFRLNKLHQEIGEEIASLYQTQAESIYNGFDTNFTQTYYYQSFGIERELNLGAGLKFDYMLNTPVLNKAAVEAAFSMKIAGFTFADRQGINKQVMQWKLREVVSGVIAEGQSVEQLAKRFRNLDDVFGANKAKAMTTARTELLRAYSYGNDEAKTQADDAGVQFQFSWSAALAGNTRPDHRAMDGKRAQIIDGQPVFTLPDGSKAAGPRMVAVDSKGNQIGNLAADESINCRCRRLDLPYGIQPSARVAQMPKGTWVEVNGDMTAEKWYKMHYEEAA
jgi:hypothetical protein